MAQIVAVQSVGPIRPIAEPAEREYKALRDEILNLFTRIFVLLAAVVGATATVFARVWNSSHLSDERLFALLAIVAILLLSVLATIKFYDHVARVGSYLEVVHERKAAGWHEINRQILQYADSVAGREAIDALLKAQPDRRRLVRRWVRVLARSNERSYVAFVYLALSVLAGVGISVEWVRHETAPVRWWLLFCGWLLSLLLPFAMFVDQNRYWKRVWTARLQATPLPDLPNSGATVAKPPKKLLEVQWGSFRVRWQDETRE